MGEGARELGPGVRKDCILSARRVVKEKHEGDEGSERPWRRGHSRNRVRNG